MTSGLFLSHGRDDLKSNRSFTCSTADRQHAVERGVCSVPAVCNSLPTSSSAIAEGPRDASCQLKSCQLPRNSAETTYTTSPDQIDGMKLEI